MAKLGIDRAVLDTAALCVQSVLNYTERQAPELTAAGTKPTFNPLEFQFKTLNVEISSAEAIPAVLQLLCVIIGQR
jgi:RNA 3'-terminal phosphate cyclase